MSELCNNFSYLVAILVFIGTFVLNVLYAKFTLSVVALRPILSANLSFCILLINLINIIFCIKNYVYAIPMLLGAWLGTFILVYKNKKIKERNRNNGY